ncbi:MAG: hypothetical protein PCFJNLEI_03145 [Verrucomicrobiae bacterium]|nr:hypothetical protein [Verrucomicrobiae bacterium]
MNAWDWALILTVSVMGTAVAYLRNPEHKAFVLMLPIPFTFALLTVGKPLDATNVWAMLLMFGYTVAAWALYVRLKLPIVVAIVIAVAGYCLIGTGITSLQLTGDGHFWLATVVTFAVGVALIRWLPYREEPHHRTPLPLWIKFPAIVMVILGVLQIKNQLGGFTTAFPMVGVVATYEARYSLWTNVRRIPWILVLVIPMMICIRCLQPQLGMGWALALSWVVYLAGLGVFHMISRKAFVEEAD